MSDVQTIEQQIEQRAREHFEANTREHVMTIEHEDGVYRHLRFSQPGTVLYSYSLVTWPGHLAISGDIESFTFRRLHDMTLFFADNGYGINAHYWSEKLVAPRGRDAVRVFDPDAARDRVREWLADRVDDLDEPEAAALTEAVEERLLNDWDATLMSEDGFRQALTDFDVAGGIPDAWEWSLRTFDYHFLHACWATVRGLEQYRAHVAARDAETAGGATTGSTEGDAIRETTPSSGETATSVTPA